MKTPADWLVTVLAIVLGITSIFGFDIVSADLERIGGISEVDECAGTDLDGRWVFAHSVIQSNWPCWLDIGGKEPKQL